MLAAVQSLWIGASLSALERLTIQSYLANGHRFQLYVYDEVANVPEGTALLDANAILPRERLFTSHGGAYAIFADWFRWTLLERHGGAYWVDMDLVCLKPFDLADEVVFGQMSADKPGVSVLKFPAGNEVARAMRERCEQARAGAAQEGWGNVGGPRAFKEQVQKRGLEHRARPIDEFYPVRFWQWRNLFEPTPRLSLAGLEKSYGVHFWNEMLRKEGVDKDGEFAEGSLFEQLKAKYR